MQNFASLATALFLYCFTNLFLLSCAGRKETRTRLLWIEQQGEYVLHPFHSFREKESCGLCRLINSRQQAQTSMGDQPTRQRSDFTPGEIRPTSMKNTLADTIPSCKTGEQREMGGWSLWCKYRVRRIYSLPLAKALAWKVASVMRMTASVIMSFGNDIGKALLLVLTFYQARHPYLIGYLFK
jgi:hypothetical protein